MNLYYLVICVLALTFVSCNETELRLRNKLFKNYNKELRPVQNLSDSVSINLTVTPIFVREFNSQTGKMNALIEFKLEWCDEHMLWKASDYGNITRLDVKSDKLWLPQLNFAQEFTSSGENNYDVIIENNCHMKWLLFQTLYITCNSDIASYPFSVVNCGFSLSLQNQLSSSAKFGTFVLKRYEYFKFSDWRVSFKKRFLAVDEFKYIRITLTLKKQMNFFDVTLIIFLALMSMLSVIVNLMPVDSGEKVTIVTTIFLGNLVYLLGFKSELPWNTDTTPVLIIHQTLTTIANGLSTIAAVLGTLVYGKEDKTLTTQPVVNCKVTPENCLNVMSSNGNGNLKEMLTRKIKNFTVNKRWNYDLFISVVMAFILSGSFIWSLSYM